MPNPDEIESHIENLDFIQGILADTALTDLAEFWDNASASFNGGQYTMYQNSIVWALYDWELGAAEDWPWIDSQDYVDAVYMAEDVDIMERAFSDTIDGPVPKLDDHIERGQEIDLTIQLLEDLLSAFG